MDWCRFSNPTRKLYEYALTLRPVSRTTVPEGFVAFRNDPKWSHGVVQYDRPLSRRDIEHFDLEPLDPLDPINLKRSMDRFKEVLYEEFAEKDIVVLPTRSGKASLTWSTRPDVEFQVTYWDKEGTPTGHIDFNDFDRAAYEMYPGRDWEEVWERRERR